MLMITITHGYNLLDEMVETAYLDIFPPPFVVIASAHSALRLFPTFVIDITVNGHTFVLFTEDTVIIPIKMPV